MRVVDTSAWIEWLSDTPLGRTLADEMPSQDQCIVPTIVQLELMKWLLREKGEDEADKILAYTLKCRVVALDTELAVAAAELCRDLKLATADAVVYATARAFQAELLTCDAHFIGLPSVIYRPKPSQ